MHTINKCIAEINKAWRSTCSPMSRLTARILETQLLAVGFISFWYAGGVFLGILAECCIIRKIHIEHCQFLPLFKLYCSCCSWQWHQDCERLGAPMWNNIQESDFGSSPRNFCVRCLALWSRYQAPQTVFGFLRIKVQTDAARRLPVPSSCDCTHWK